MPRQRSSRPANTAPAVEPLQQADTSSVWKWFHPINWVTGFITFAISFGTYVYTLQPTVGLEDSGELITAAYKLGVPHPPGYPMWTLMSKLFTFIPIGDIAYRVNLFSAFVGALAAAMIALVLAKTGDLFFGEQEKELGEHHIASGAESIGLTIPRIVNSLCAITAGLLFAFTPGTWSQATIAEVYAFNCFFMALLVFLSLVFMFHHEKRWLLYLITFVFALAFTNHQTIIVMGWSLLWLVIATRKNEEHLLILLANGVVFLVFTYMIWGLKIDNVPIRLMTFEGGKFFFTFVLAFIAYLVVTGVINFLLFNHTEWTKILASFYAGLSIYFYLPLSSLTNPQLNWARPRTVEGFWHSILRGQYEKVSFKRDIDLLGKQLLLYIKDTWDQYPIVLIFAFVSILALVILWKRRYVRSWMIYCIVTFFSCGIVMVFLMNPKIDITSQYINRVFFIMSHAALGLLVGYGMITVSTVLFSLARRTDPMWKMLGIGISGVLVLFGVLIFLVYSIGDTASLTSFTQNTVYVYGGVLLIVIGLLALAGVAVRELSFIASTLIALCLLLTVLIPCLENWNDMNLRKKYFGYIYGIEMLRRCDEGAVFYGGTDPGRFVPLYMINCDKFRPDVWLITQNGLADATYMNTLRDRFCKPQPVWGWVRAILKLLDAEREDHKGEDTIYIPSKMDFERAFQIYVEDVKKRKARGEPIEEDVQIVDGKISVGGVAGVMRINGILTKMIWQQNKDKHSFYVEESYVIPWMYPYMEPAGLILKLCAEKTELTPEKVAADFEYWNTITNIFGNGGVINFEDKHTGRKGRIIVDEGEFEHDLTAQKSFSKCRSAIAGLYEERQMWDAAENAYRQAIWLYPQSAEAYMRLANMFMKRRMPEKALEYVQEYKEMDPLNDRIDGMLDMIKRQVKTVGTFEQLQKKVNSKEATWEDILELATLYIQMGQQQAGLQTLDYMMSPHSGITNKDAFMQLAGLFTANKDLQRKDRAYQRMVQLFPDDWNILMEAAVAQMDIGQYNPAIETLKKALEIDAERTKIRMQQDGRITQHVKKNSAFQKQYNLLLKQ